MYIVVYKKFCLIFIVVCYLHSYLYKMFCKVVFWAFYCTIAVERRRPRSIPIGTETRSEMAIDKKERAKLALSLSLNTSTADRNGITFVYRFAWLLTCMHINQAVASRVLMLTICFWPSVTICLNCKYLFHKCMCVCARKARLTYLGALG